MKPSNFLLAGLLVLCFGVLTFYRVSHPDKPAAPVVEETSKNPDNRLVFTCWGSQVWVRILQDLDDTGRYVFTIQDSYRRRPDLPKVEGRLSKSQVADLGAYLMKADLSPDLGDGPEARLARTEMIHFAYKQTYRSDDTDSATLNQVLSRAPHIGEAYRKALALAEEVKKNQPSGW